MRGDVLVGGEVEVVEGLDAGQLRFVHAPGSSSFVADVELDAQRFGEERRVGDPPSGGVIEHVAEHRGESGGVLAASTRWRCR